MKVICIGNTGKEIPISERMSLESDRTSYAPLKIGEEYEVYGLMFKSRQVKYFVEAEGLSVMWAPSCLFKILDATIPSGWVFCNAKENEAYQGLFESFEIISMIGYPLLVTDMNHYVGLLERDHIELRKFLDYKRDNRVDVDDFY